VAGINRCPDADDLWRELYDELVCRTVNLIKQRNYRAAYALYKARVRRLRRLYCETRPSGTPAAVYHPQRRSVAAIAAVFNPQRSRRRLLCYQTFAKHFVRHALPLYVVEAAAVGRETVPDGPSVLRVPWEPDWFAKEALLNYAIRRLPDRFDAVLWTDTDVLFDDLDFADKLQAALRQHDVVQAAADLVFLDQFNRPTMAAIPSLMAVRTGLRGKSPLRQEWPGLAWAARRDLLETVGGLYDRCVTGGGDDAWACAVCGDDLEGRMKSWNQPLIDDVARYCGGVRPLIQSVSVVEVSARHLYHGALEHRQYATRHQILHDWDFDPQTHLVGGNDGILRWTDAAPSGLRAALRDYLHGTKEDLT
jgi:hypothetical protein